MSLHKIWECDRCKFKHEDEQWVSRGDTDRPPSDWAIIPVGHQLTKRLICPACLRSLGEWFKEELERSMCKERTDRAREEVRRLNCSCGMA